MFIFLAEFILLDNQPIKGHYSRDSSFEFVTNPNIPKTMPATKFSSTKMLVYVKSEMGDKAHMHHPEGNRCCMKYWTFCLDKNEMIQLPNMPALFSFVLIHCCTRFWHFWTRQCLSCMIKPWSGWKTYCSNQSHSRGGNVFCICRICHDGQLCPHTTKMMSDNEYCTNGLE